MGRARSDVGAVCRRGSYPARLRGQPARRRRRFPARSIRARSRSALEMTVTRVHEPPRVTKPYTPRTMVGHRPARRTRRRRAARARRAPDDGRRTDLRLDRRHGRRRVDDRRGRSDEARLRRHADPAAARSFCAGRLAALRSGEMVSGRVAAALGVRAVLARRRHAAYGTMPSASRARRPTRSRRAKTPARSRAASRSGSTSIPSSSRRPTKMRSTLVAKEAALPENVTTLDSKLDDPEERARLARSFSRGLNTPAAYVLPVQRWNSDDKRRWRSERWSTRAGRVQLVPGDSPAGLRLPLGSLPWLEPEDRPVGHTARSVRPAAAVPGRKRSRRSVRAATSLCHERCARSESRAPAVCRARNRDRRLRAHRALGRTARRTSLRLHAADRNGRRLSSSCSERSRRPRRNLRRRSTSRAIRRRTIRASTSSRSRPIPA